MLNLRPITAFLLALLLCANPVYARPPSRGVAPPSGATPLSTFLATCSTDQWCQPTNASAVASNIYYASGKDCGDTYSTSACATSAADYNSTTATHNTGTDTAHANWGTWSGGAYDTKLNRIIAFGGAHFGYCGNEGYAFDIPKITAYRMRTPTDYQTGTTVTITSGTYDNATGNVVLTLTGVPADFANGYNWTVANLTGTGSVSSLEGTPILTYVDSTHVSYTAATGLGSITITGGTINSVCSTGNEIQFQNGDPSVAHEYTAPLFIPNGSCNSAPDGSWFSLVPDGVDGAMLDLSKGAPYVSLPTTTGAPASGWSLFTLPNPTYRTTTPTLSMFDPATCRVYTENSQIGGGPNDIYYYDLVAKTFSSSGLTGTNSGIVPGNATGLGRTGHSEIWGFGYTNTVSPFTGNAMKVALSNGAVTAWSMTNYSSLPNPSFPGVCYSPTADHFYIWGGGSTLIDEDASTEIDTLYSPSVAAGVTMPPSGSISTNEGAMTKMICDEADHIIVLWWDGAEAPFILKTSKF